VECLGYVSAACDKDDGMVRLTIQFGLYGYVSASFEPSQLFR
jgi:hypothetical protein